MGLICAIPLISALISGCDTADVIGTGYVEGSYALIAPIEVSHLDKVLVRAGQRVGAGAVLAQMKTGDADFALAQAKAALDEAQAHLQDVQAGQRPEDIALIEASHVSANAQAADAARSAQRVLQLAKSGSATKAQADAAQTALDMANAHLAEVAARLTLARLPARAQVVAAAIAAEARAKAAFDRAAWALQQRRLTAPSGGIVTDILRYPGEVAGPSAPVLSFLPDGGVTLRLYVAEAALPQIALGARLTLHCAGCTGEMIAEVSYIADHPEFTPPVIYSLQNAQKLVVLVEATPLGEALALKPGQIVDASLALAGK